MKRELKVHIGVSLCGTASLAPESALDALLEAFARSPLHWVLAAQPVFEKRGAAADRLIAEIRARLSRFGDVIVAAGYAGAPHPLLTVEETSRELEWSHSNPWRSGLTDVFRKNADILIPTTADFDRPETIELYRRHGFRSIGLPVDPAAAAYQFLGTPPADDISVFHYYPLSESDDEKPTRFVKSYFPRDLERVFFLARPDDPASIDRLRLFLDALRQRFEFSITPFEHPKAAPFSKNEAHALVPETPAPPNDTPLLRLLRGDAARMRVKGKLLKQDMRELLLLSAGEPEEVTKARQSLPPKSVAREGTAYTANMPGEILLPGVNFDARFSGGLFRDLTSGKESLLAATAAPPRAWASLAGREQPLTFDRVFSFEKNDLRGLEAFVLFPGPEREHVFTLRYAFSGEAPWLLISGERLQRPSAPFEHFSAFAPLEIPVGTCSPNSPLEVRRRYPDGSIARTVFTGGESATALAGTVFSVTHPGRRLIFGYASHKADPVDLLEFRVVREKKRSIVCMNPFGVYRPESIPTLFETGEIRSFYIGVKNEEPDKPPLFPAAVYKSIPSHALFRLP